MKIKWIFFLLLCHSITEAQPLERLVDENKLWSTLWQSGFNPPPYFEYTSYTGFSGDVEIGPYHYMEVSDLHASGYIREDSTNKVFFIDNEYPTEMGRLLYDFGAKVGDTVEIFPPGSGSGWSLISVVDNVDSVWVCDRFKKRIFWADDIWVEGIGSIVNGVMMPGVKYVGVGNSFYCYIENDTIKNPESDCVPCPDTCCYVDYVKVDETEPDRIDVTIFPNPVCSVSILTIDGAAGKVYAIEIYAVTGEKVRTDEVRDGQMLISRAGYRPGLYLFRLFNGGMKITCGKFMVK